MFKFKKEWMRVTIFPLVFGEKHTPLTIQYPFGPYDRKMNEQEYVASRNIMNGTYYF
jgi:hypothetical protein